MAISEKRLTLDEFLKLRERKPALEFADGVVTQKPMPKGKHSALQYALAEAINRFALTSKLARAFPELRTTYTGRSYVPDVAVYGRDCIPHDPDGRVADDFFDPPDLAIEIVSPKQSGTALVRKCLWYVENGVLVPLLVDPADESVLLFRLGRATRALRESDRVELGDALPGFALTVADIFGSGCSDLTRWKLTRLLSDYD